MEQRSTQAHRQFCAYCWNNIASRLIYFNNNCEIEYREAEPMESHDDFKVFTTSAADVALRATLEQEMHSNRAH